ncbi:MAG: hypothetical protein HY076_07725 [Candidatus Eisenbacteria bacterium]|uniref:Uncharacterized protein n=1 Tax=Eiseniibacteriota bacterium TaxID=2212470 RepID=A0A9D6L5D2_UNCEI|nr:hypothetical protein [Candidatus Eisenbacteria bacterium]MBI3540147.1 hypothetical protein [Candidatus Eisenbacteria bacterium]
MAEINRVVAHFTDGRLLKGTTQDFFPNRPSFHLQPAVGGAPVEVRCRQLKGLFFVKDFAGNAKRRDLRGFLAAPGETAHGKKIAVRFKDGELLCGYSLTFMPDRDGFFVFPSDSGSNNLRIYVLSVATAEVKAGPAADVLAQKVLAAGGD